MDLPIPPPNMPDCGPFTECWCSAHPGNPNCFTMSIENSIVVPIILTLILGYIFYLKIKLSKNDNKRKKINTFK